MNTSSPFICVRPASSIGRRKLSIRLMPPAPIASRAMPRPISPVRSSHTATGSQTIQAPSGNNEKNAMMTPQNTGRAKPEHRKGEAAHCSLNERDGESRADAGFDELGRFADAPFAERRIERQHPAEPAHDGVAVAKEEEQREQHDDDVDEDNGDASRDKPGAFGDEPGNP